MSEELKKPKTQCMCEADGQGISFECPLHGSARHLPPLFVPLKDEVAQRVVMLNLYRSLHRLHLAIKECGRIGFEESSPTKNAHHAAVWMNLNDAQKDAEVKLRGYENFVLAEKIRSDPDDDPSVGGGPPS